MKVLIALDYNPTAQKVAEEGYEMAKAMGAEVFIMHVIADPAYYSSSDYSPIMGFSGYLNTESSTVNLMESIRQYSFNFLSQTKNHLYDQTIKVLVEEGNTADCIIASSGKLAIDIIVMGSHSRKWLEKIIMGSVTEKVLNLTDIPLFIVPTRK
ncbi:MAG: universal stress protein [Chryseolinea sp.]